MRKVVQIPLHAGSVMLDVKIGIASLDKIEPGQSSQFQVLRQIPYEDVASYIVQMEP